METWFVVINSLCVALVIKTLFFRRSNGKKQPQGPSFLYSNFIRLTNSNSELEPILRKFKSKYGPLFTLSIGSHPSIFVCNHSLAHEILIQIGAIFSDRPGTPDRNVSFASYGPTWRVLRRNLASEVLHPFSLKSHSWARKWVLQILLSRLQEKEEAAGIKVIDHFRYAMLSMLVLMCFGEKLDENRINEIATVQRRLLLLAGSGRFNVFDIFPRLRKILFKNRWKEFEQICKDQEQVLIPLIRSRIKAANSKPQSVGDERVVAYVDTLVKLQLPKEDANNSNGGKLTLMEMVDICEEFLTAGTDTTSTTLQWIMVNLVKHPDIQSKLYDEIVSVVGNPPPPPPPGVEPETAINEEELKKMPYLKAVVLEALRRHPAAHFVLPHCSTKEMEVQGFTIPQDAIVNFMVAEMGMDPKVWEDPMEFKPERFMANGDFDISGRKGIKMMPFGAGKRMCPGYNLALLHLEYFVANLIWYFNWSAPDGYHVDLSEKAEFTIVMKNPLQAQISSRTEKITS